MVNTYEKLKEWRAKNPEYHKDFMRDQRRYYRRLWKQGLVAYKDIPRSYRYWKLKAR